METSYDVISIHRQAAKSDPKVKVEYRKVLDNRAKTFETFINGLRRGLARGVTARIATDLLWAFSNEELYQELVGERGWTHDVYEQWLGSTLVQQLVTDSTPLSQPTQPTRKARASGQRR